MISDGYECKEMVTRPVFCADLDFVLGWGRGKACGERFISKDVHLILMFFCAHPKHVPHIMILDGYECKKMFTSPIFVGIYANTNRSMPTSMPQLFNNLHA